MSGSVTPSQGEACVTVAAIGGASTGATVDVTVGAWATCFFLFLRVFFPPPLRWLSRHRACRSAPVGSLGALTFGDGKPRNVVASRARGVGRIVSIRLDHFITSRRALDPRPAPKFGSAGSVHVLH
jgi:hypothetical protein